MDEQPVTFRVVLEDYEPAPVEICSHCGQSHDVRDLSQILHHRSPNHAPLTAQG